MSEADIRALRLKKLDILKAAGMEAYPAAVSRTISVADFIARFDELAKSGKSETAAGRLMSLRGQGGIVFADIFDGSGKTQLVLQKGDVDEKLFQLWSEAIDIGDFVEATGVPYTTKRGEKSLKVSEWRMLAKSLLPIPAEHFGIKDEETRLRERELDTC